MAFFSETFFYATTLQQSQSVYKKRSSLPEKQGLQLK